MTERYTGRQMQVRLGRKWCRLKGYAAFCSTPENTGRSKAVRDSGLNTLLAGREESGAGRAKRCKTPIAGFYEYRRRKALAGRAKKQRIGVYMEKELVERADEMVSYVGARSRNEFVAEGVRILYWIF